MFIHTFFLLAAQDSRLVIDRYKTGFLPPGDVPFEDLSNAAASQGNNGSSKADTSNRLAGTAAVRGKKRAGFRGIFGAPKVYRILYWFIAGSGRNSYLPSQ
jgi:hypothetical protein